MATTVRLHYEQIVFSSLILLEFAVSYIMLFLLILLLVACLMQFSALSIARDLRYYFRIQFAETGRGLGIKHLIEPVIYRLRYIMRLFQVLQSLLCLSQEQHSPPIVVLDSTLRLQREVPKVELARLKIDSTYTKRYDWDLLNK